MLMTEVIRAKRDGRVLPPDVIRQVIADYTAGTVPDYQMAALLMAIVLRGLDDDETTAWAQAMLRSGDVMDFSDIPGAKVDKHSTGGVGDKISIPLAPLVAACGVRVPMISGRGLGHTGGTLDKLESIPGFSTRLSVERFREGVARVGTAMIGQTDALVPADRKLYALRDVTGTVESIPLICASITSKKLAEGISGLVLDVKVGSGAFMKTLDQARELGRKLVAIGTGAGVRTVAFLTDMNQPLGWAVGNALEVRESIEILRGQGPEDTTELTVTFGGAMLWLGGAAGGLEEGRQRIRAAMADGSGVAKFREMVAFQGGDPTVADAPDRLPTAAFTEPVTAEQDGFVVSVDTEKVGLACVLLGGGRRRKEDVIDPAVGFRIHARIGSRVRKGDPLVSIHHQGNGSLAEVKDTIRAAYRLADLPVPSGPLVIETIR